MEQNREPQNKLPYMWSNDLPQGAKTQWGKDDVFEQAMLWKLNILMQKREVGLLHHTKINK